jgi:predicted RND superfamily exporter protein
MLTFFPALLVLVDRRHADRPGEQEPRAHAVERVHVPVLEQLGAYPGVVLIAAGLITAASLWGLPKVRFDYNLLNLQAAGTESVVWERRILATTGRSGFNGLASAGSLDELRGKHEAFARLPSVSGVDSVLHLIPDGQAEKIRIVESFAPVVEPVRVGRLRPVDMDRLLRAFGTLRRRFDLAIAEGGTQVPDEIRQLRSRTDEVLRGLASADRNVAQPVLNHLQAQLYRDFVDKFHALQRNLRPHGITAADVPEELSRKFVGQSGRFLIQIHPKVDIWERAGAEQFVRELRTVDPDVTGPPVITFEAIGFMERAYRQGTLYAFALVALLSYLVIRRARETLLALLPLVLGVLWTIGLMRLFDLQFTMANVWGLPLIIGTSAEFGLNVVMRYLEGREHGGPLVARSTVMAVAVNGLTTIVGFGSLMVAEHQGIFGLGLLLTIGASCALVASLIVLPVLLRMLPGPARARSAPAEASGSPAA